MASMGFNVRWAFEAAGGTFDSSSLRFDLVSDTVRKTGAHLDSPGISGTRTLREDRKRIGAYAVGGTLVFDMSYRVLDFFLPYMLGAAESIDTFDTADTLPAFDMVTDRVGDVVKYTGLTVNRATVRYQPGLVKLALDVIGKTEDINAIMFAGAALGTDSSYAPIVLHDSSVFTLQSGARALGEGELVIDNQLIALFRNEQTAQEIVPQGRLVTLTSSHPSSSAEWAALYGDKAAVDATIAFSRSGMASTATLFNLSNPDETPVTNSKNEIVMGLRSQARGDGADPDIRWVNDPVAA